jgi:hypothetical protein
MKEIAALTLALALFSAPLSSARALSAADFMLVNNTGYTIKSIRFKAHNAPYWGNDALFNAVLFQGGSMPIEFYYLPSCNLDIQIEYLNGATDTYVQGRNLCRTKGIRFLKGFLSSW